MNLSDYLLKFLQEKKIKHVFTLTGGAVSFLIDAFTRNKNINYVAVAHEQAASMMADSYSRVGPNFSCTMATSGPGATNLITGIACSYFDSIPSLHITGQVNTYEQQSYHPSTKNVRQVGFQETDIVNIIKPITKFSYKLKNASEIKYILEKSYHIATSGRPGPVLIDIPMDFQRKVLNFRSLKGFKPKKKLIKVKILKKKIIQIQKKIEKSSRPVIILGGGIKYARAEKKIRLFLKNFDIPIVSTWSGLDLIDHRNKNYIGNIGVYGSRAANFSVQNSDLLLCIGSRLDTRVTGGVPKSFARGAYKIVVDVDKNELNKKRGVEINIKVNEDINDFVSNYLKIKKFKIKKNKWLDQCVKWKKKYLITNENHKDKKNKINPYKFITNLSDVLDKNDIIISSTGAHLTWVMQSFMVKYGQKLYSAFGNSPMGYALPASIAASLIKNKKKIICLDGDGSLLLSIQELNTVKKLNLPIKIFIFNNNGYGIIKQFQELYLNKRYQATGKEVSNLNFKKIATAFGINYNNMKNNYNKKKIKKIISSNNPEIIELHIDQYQKIVPKLTFGKPLEDLTPLLSRNEFKKNMSYIQ